MKSASLLSRRTYLVVAAAATASILACSNRSDPSGLSTQQLSDSADTVTGTGELNELQQRRAAWVARGIADYRVQLSISCFCGGDLTRPVLIEVRGGAISKVWDLETSKLVAYANGIPARLEIGTIANDAGTLYFLGEFSAL